MQSSEREDKVQFVPLFLSVGAKMGGGINTKKDRINGGVTHLSDLMDDVINFTVTSDTFA